MSQKIERVVLPGTYDPVTMGHLDVVQRSVLLFPKVIVAVAASKGKHGTGTTFSLEARVEMVRESLDELKIEGVEVLPFEGLLVNFCQEVGAGAVVKGLRSITDFEYELQQADLNARLAPDLESVFVMASPTYGYLSSSIVRELASLKASVDNLVPQCVAARLAEHYASEA
ncbi:MAG: pantetheine-phosphate adenylyltransferase [Coriobacteriales bacterium]|nr:pantetheine-phosphate adenylyltransferase [Coriobacteriales bacterium]